MKDTQKTGAKSPESTGSAMPPKTVMAADLKHVEALLSGGRGISYLIDNMDAYHEAVQVGLITNKPQTGHMAGPLSVLGVPQPLRTPVEGETEGAKVVIDGLVLESVGCTLPLHIARSRIYTAKAPRIGVWGAWVGRAICWNELHAQDAFVHRVYMGAQYDYRPAHLLRPLPELGGNNSMFGHIVLHHDGGPHPMPRQPLVYGSPIPRELPLEVGVDTCMIGYVEEVDLSLLKDPL